MYTHDEIKRSGKKKKLTLFKIWQTKDQSCFIFPVNCTCIQYMYICITQP